RQQELDDADHNKGEIETIYEISKDGKKTPMSVAKSQSNFSGHYDTTGNPFSNLDILSGGGHFEHSYSTLPGIVSVEFGDGQGDNADSAPTAVSVETITWVPDTDDGGGGAAGEVGSTPVAGGKKFDLQAEVSRCAEQLFGVTNVTSSATKKGTPGV